MIPVQISLERPLGSHRRSGTLVGINSRVCIVLYSLPLASLLASETTYRVLAPFFVRAGSRSRSPIRRATVTMTVAVWR